MALSFGNRHRNLTANVWPTHRQPLIVVRKQQSFVETGNTFNISNKGRGLSVGRSYDGIRQKLNSTGTTATLRNAGSFAYLQRQNTLDQDFKLRTNGKPKDNNSRLSKNTNFNNSATRLSYARRNNCISNNNCENLKLKEKSIVAWSSATSLFKPDDEVAALNFKKRNSYAIAADDKPRETRKASITSQQLQQRLHSSTKGEVNKINLNIVLPQAAKIPLDNEAVASDIESSLDCGVNAESSPSKSATKNISPDFILPPPTTTTTTQSNSANCTNSAVYRRAQFRSSHLTSVPTITTSSNATSSSSTTPSTSNSAASVVATTPVTPNPPSNFSASPSLTVQRRPPLVRAMSAPVRPLDESSKGTFAAASKRKPRRRRIITRNISCDKSTEQEIFTNEIIDGKKVLARSRSVVASEVVTLVSLMSSEGSDSEREDLQISSANKSSKSESNSARRAPSLRKTGKSVSFQENYPPNFQFTTKEYSHMIRRGSIAPITARMRNSRPPTAPPGSIFLNMASNTEPIPNKERESDESILTSDENKKTIKNDSNDDKTPEYNFPDYVRSIKERECWKLHQKMCNKGVNVSYDTVLRGMLTPTEFRQIQKQRELEESKQREAEAANLSENIKPPSQSAIDRLSEALLKKQ